MDKTLTPFLRGRVKIVQPRRGYRFSLDAVLLASYVEGEGFALELGTGFGPVALMVKSRLRNLKILALDILVDYLLLLRESLGLNGYSGIYPVAGDVKKPPLRGKFDLVFSNPPYLNPRRFRISPIREVAASKWEILANLDDFLAAAFKFLREDSPAYFIVGKEAEDFESRSKRAGFEVEERVEILDGGKVEFFLYQLKKGKGAQRVYSFPMKKEGKYTREMEEILGGAPLRLYLR